MDTQKSLQWIVEVLLILVGADLSTILKPVDIYHNLNRSESA